MALPPEPLDDVLPQARLVVVGRVLSVEDLEAWPPPHRGPPDSAPPLPRQRAQLAVTRVLAGAPGSPTLVVAKPAGAYALRAGVEGVFLLDDGAEPAVLGRYGPDSWGDVEVEQALSARGRAP